jgi:hypothetical protein
VTRTSNLKIILRVLYDMKILLLIKHNAYIK